MARLPVPGGDDDQWGAILNDYLAQSHAADGHIATALAAYFGSYRVRIEPNNVVSWGDGAGAYDTNLYREAANVLKTGGSLIANGFLRVNSGGGINQMDLGLTLAGAAAPHLTFGGDTSLHRSAANTLTTPGSLLALQLLARSGGAGQVIIGDDGTVARIVFGVAGDTTWFREAAQVLRTNGVIKAQAFTVAAAATGKPGDDPGDEVEINLLDLIETLRDRIEALESKLAE